MIIIHLYCKKCRASYTVLITGKNVKVIEPSNVDELECCDECFISLSEQLIILIHFLYLIPKADFSKRKT